MKKLITIVLIIIVFFNINAIVYCLEHGYTGLVIEDITNFWDDDYDYDDDEDMKLTFIDKANDLADEGYNVYLVDIKKSGSKRRYKYIVGIMGDATPIFEKNSDSDERIKISDELLGFVIIERNSPDPNKLNVIAGGYYDVTSLVTDDQGHRIYKYNKKDDVEIISPEDLKVYFGEEPVFEIKYNGTNTIYDTYESFYVLFEYPEMIDSGLLDYNDIYEFDTGEIHEFKLSSIGKQLKSGQIYKFVVYSYEGDISPEVASCIFKYMTIDKGIYFIGIENGRTYDYIPDNIELYLVVNEGFPYELWIDGEDSGLIFDDSSVIWDINIYQYAKTGYQTWEIKDSEGNTAYTIGFTILNKKFQDIDFKILDPSTWIAPISNFFNKLENAVAPAFNIVRGTINFLPSDWILIGSIGLSLVVLLRILGR